MKNIVKVIGSLFFIVYFQTACVKPTDSNYTVPTSYSFDNVDYSNQTRRIGMLGELAVYAKSANATGASPLNAQKMLDMYANTNSPFADADLNSSTSQLKNKTVSTVQTTFENVINSLATISLNTDSTATNGQAGIISNGTKEYLVNANGLELAQILEKGLAGACFYNQATEIYLGIGKMSVDNKIVIENKGTTMEHHWDEAFGYFGAPTDFPANTTNLSLWATYSNKVNASINTNKTIMDAFLKGRAAISANDLTTRDNMIAEIRREWEKVCAAVAISYMNDAKANSTDKAVFLHNLSEVYAFVLSLKYGGTPTVTNSEVDNILITLAGSADILTANLHNTTVADVNATIAAIVSHFSTLDTHKDSL